MAVLTADMFSGGGHGQVGRQILRQHFLGGGHHGQPAADVSNWRTLPDHGNCISSASVSGCRVFASVPSSLRFSAENSVSDAECPPPFPQRRQLHADHIQAVEQVFAEFTFCHQPLQILMSGGNNPSHPLSPARNRRRGKTGLRQHPQQPCSNIERHIADFIEKQRAAVRLLKTPCRTCDAPVNAPFHGRRVPIQSNLSGSPAAILRAINGASARGL